MFQSDHVPDGGVYRTYRADRISRAVKLDGTAMPFSYEHVKMTYAHNNGLEMIPDPNGFSPPAQRRWVPHALSSALRHGTTRHLYPATKKGLILPWQEGNDAFNIQSLRDTELAYIEQVAPQTKSWKIGPDGDTFVHADGRQITRETFEKAVEKLDPGRTQVGETSLRRGLRHKQIRSGMEVHETDRNTVPLAGLHEGGTPDYGSNSVLGATGTRPSPSIKSVSLSESPYYYLPEGIGASIRNAAAATPAPSMPGVSTSASPLFVLGSREDQERKRLMKSDNIR